MAKRILTLALAIVCLASVALVGVSALEPANETEAVFYATLQTPANIEDVQGYITYDAAALEVVEVATPNIGSAIVNYNEAGTVYFNALDVNKGLDFTAGADLIQVKFKVLSADAVSPEIVIEEMTEFNGDSYFTNSEKVNETVTLTTSFVFGQVATTATVPTTVETDPTATAVVEPTDATSSTDAPDTGADVPDTGASVAIFAVMAVIAMAGVAVVVLRKKANA